MSQVLDELLNLLQLEQIEETIFSGAKPGSGLWQCIWGGRLSGRHFQPLNKP